MAPKRILAAIVVVSVVAIGGVLVGMGTAAPSTSAGDAASANPTGVATVTRGSLVSQIEVDATLGYAQNFTIVNQAQGVITALPAVGTVVSQGHVLYRVDGEPVILLYGSTPAYRTLSDRVQPATGADIDELNTALARLGYITSAQESEATNHFGWWTREGVTRLQASVGLPQTGAMPLGQVLFLPAAARITAVAETLGASAGPGQALMSASSTARQVSIALDADQQSEVAVGDKVIITLPNNQPTPGVISSVGTVATSSPGGPAAGSAISASIAVLVTPTDPSATGSWDQAPVEVAITTASVTGVLKVPVDALLARSSGGYAVELVGPGHTRRLVHVSLGLFDDADGMVQATGRDLAAGQRIVVPAL